MSKEVDSQDVSFLHRVEEKRTERIGWGGYVPVLSCQLLLCITLYVRPNPFIYLLSKRKWMRMKRQNFPSGPWFPYNLYLLLLTISIRDRSAPLDMLSPSKIFRQKLISKWHGSLFQCDSTLLFLLQRLESNLKWVPHFLYWCSCWLLKLGMKWSRIMIRWREKIMSFLASA